LQKRKKKLLFTLTNLMDKAINIFLIDSFFSTKNKKLKLI